MRPSLREGPLREPGAGAGRGNGDAMKRILFVVAALATLAAGCTAHGGTAATRRQAAVEVSVREVDIPYRLAGMACVRGGQTYITVGGFRSDTIDTIVRTDSAGATPTVVYTGTNDIASVVSNQRWLLWVAGKRLFARDMASGRQRVLSSSRELYAPALEGDRAAWVDVEGGSSAVVVVEDLRTGRIARIARLSLPDLYNNFVQLQGDTVLWTDVVDGVGRYRMRDLSSGVTTDLPVTGTRYRYPGYALRYGQRIYSINFRATTEWDWTQQQFGYFSIPERRWVPLRRTGYIDYFRIVGDVLAVVGQDQRLLLQRLDGSGAAEDLTSRLGTTVDWIQAAGPSTLVAGATDAASGRPRLFVITVRSR